MMFASIKKELRQHIRLAILAAVALAALLVGLLYYGRGGLSLVGDTYMAITMIAFPTIGFAIGLAILLVDLRRGHFGFAVHRPMARWKLFASKFIAASVLYLAAGSMALIIAALCAANSRFVLAPFAPAMLIPSIYFLFSGLPWLACGTLVAARQARWIGSRLFPVAITFVAVVFIRAWSIHFYEAISLVIVAMTFLAALGAAYYTTNGEYVPLTKWAKLPAGIVVSVGAAVVLVAAFEFSLEVVQNVFLRPPPSYPIDSYQLDSDGGVELCKTVDGQTKYCDMNGTPLPPRKPIRFSDIRPYPASINFWNTAAADASRFDRVNTGSFLNASAYLSQVTKDADSRHWFFVRSRRTLESITPNGDFAGSLGPENFLTDARLSFPTATQYRGTNRDYGMGFLLASPTTVWFADLNTRSVITVFHAVDDAPILNATLYDWSVDDWGDGYGSVTHSGPMSNSHFHAMIVTRDRLHVIPVFDRTNVARSVPIPLIAANAWMQVAELDHGGLAVLIDRLYLSDTHLPTLVTLRDGVVTNGALPPIKLPAEALNAPVPWTTTLESALTPPGLLFIKLALNRNRIRLNIPTLLVFINSVLLVLSTLWITRRRGLPRSAASVWGSLSVIFGWFIPLTVICLRERPTRVYCPSCGKSRIVTRDTCEHCGNGFPSPGDPAIAIFDDTRHAA